MIVLVHIGEGEVPTYISETIAILTKLIEDRDITFIRSKNASADFPTAKNLCTAFYEEIPPSTYTIEFENKSKLNREFRSGFWHIATKRLFLVHDWMKSQGVDNVCHLENDIVLYEDITRYIEEFTRPRGLAYSIGASYAYASILFIRDYFSLEPVLAQCISNPEKNEMENLQSIFLKRPQICSPLPTIPHSYVKARKLDPEKNPRPVKSTEVERIFDPAGIGQYVGGTDNRNDTGIDTTFFQIDNYEMPLSEARFFWDVKNNLKQPKIEWGGVKYGLVNFHVHSKQIKRFSPFNHFVPKSEEEVISISNLVNRNTLIITTQTLLKLYPDLHNRTSHLYILRQQGDHLYFPHDEHYKFIDDYYEICTFSSFYHSIKSIFGILQKPHHFTILPTIPLELDLAERMYLDQFSLEKLTIIGNGFEHFKIEHAPLGITGFGSSDYKRVIVDAAKNIEKSHLILYAEAADKTLTAGYEYVALAKIPQIKLLKYQNYRDYIEVLKSSKYMICAPSIYSDSFGFWESIHLNTVPVIMRDQWKKVYTGHRVLVVDSLTDLLSMDLEREYVRFF